MPEVELKLAADVADLPRIRRALPEGHSRPPRTTLVSTYYDTADRQLARRRLVLRVRRQRRRYIQAVKSQDVSGAAAATRGEWEDVIAGERPDLSAPNSGGHLPAAIGEHELCPLFSTEIRRAVVPIRLDASTEIEVALDEGSVRTADGVRSEPICEVELELKRGDAAALYELALRLLDIAPLRIEMRTKAERGFQLLDGAADAPSPARALPVDLTAEMTVEEALQRIGFECLAMIMRNEPAALADVPEGVHQMRIAVRRLRSMITAVRRMLPPQDYEWVRLELKWLAGALGPARNWDMFSIGILAPVKSALLSGSELAGLSRVSEQERRSAHEQAEVAIRSTQYTIALLKLSRWFGACGWRDQPLNEYSALLMAPIGEVAPNLIARLYKKARAAADRFDELTLKQRHEVRIRIKKLRYTIDVLGSLFAKDEVAKFAQRLKPLQDDLGHANDVSVASELLADLRVSENPAVIGRAAGVVLGWHDRGLADHERKLLKHVR
jgi:triphosphatase